ncbi:hypothetical protein CK203_094075 [Vitis vinifera]|uniref:Uncharacterized protein n=1 Tax=Vitis vinifera TaxID=29760 RepID=A0A438E187_VITVI|nr:hypothetical protein CK203_094075 [Vitis vinifera]
MVTAPPIEENSDCRAKPFHFELYFDLEEFFYSRMALDFYQSMTTHGAWSPTTIHFSIDGRQGILEARHVVEALHIPYEQVDPTYLWEWSPVSQRDMVHILSRETFVDSVLLPPMPEATYIAPFTTLTVPPDAPSTSEASITISTIEFCTMHLGLLPPPQPDIPGPSKPIAPVEETTRVDVPIQPTQEATSEASSPPEAPTT